MATAAFGLREPTTTPPPPLVDAEGLRPPTAGEKTPTPSGAAAMASAPPRPSCRALPMPTAPSTAASVMMSSLSAAENHLCGREPCSAICARACSPPPLPHRVPLFCGRRLDVERLETRRRIAVGERRDRRPSPSCDASMICRSVVSISNERASKRARGTKLVAQVVDSTARSPLATAPTKDRHARRRRAPQATNAAARWSGNFHSFAARRASIIHETRHFCLPIERL